MTRHAEAEANRARMPETARLVDAFRTVFGRGVRVVWAEEGGHQLGMRRAPVRSMDADQWLHFVATGERPCSP